MTPTFNLVDEAWLPVVRADGSTAELSLRQTLFQAHDLRELYGETPLVTAALHRLLLALLHRVFGPDGRSTWKRLWQAGQWEAGPLEDYLDRWRGRFDLFHPEVPFFQTANPTGKPRPVNVLAAELASGNNATLFDHTLDTRPQPLPVAQAARLATTVQTFHLAGLAGPGASNFTDAPWARGVIFLAHGDSLFQTLALNLVHYSHDSPIPGGSDDRPVWEQDDPFQLDRDIPFGYLDYLTWPSRRLRLLPEDDNGQVWVGQAWIAQGLRLSPRMLESDPMKVYRERPKQGWLPLRFSEERSLWRDSDTLFRLKDGAIRSPAAFQWLGVLAGQGALPRAATYRYMALGMANDQAKVHFFRHERLPLPLDLLVDENLVESLQHALQRAEAGGQALHRAAWELAVWLLFPERQPGERTTRGEEKDIRSVMAQLGVERRYWSRLELHFQGFVEDLSHDEAGAGGEWQARLLAAARAAFEEAAADVAGAVRGFKAVTLARRRLEIGLAGIVERPVEPDAQA